MNSKPLILIVDDDAELSGMVVELLQREGWATHAVLTGGDGHVTDTTTGPNGGTRTRQVDRTATSTTATVTHVNGTTTTRDTERSASGSTTTVTGPQGRTGTITTSH